MLKMVDGTGIIGVDMICPLGVSTPQPPNYDRVELEGTGMLVLPNSLDAPLERLELGGKTAGKKEVIQVGEFEQGTITAHAGTNYDSNYRVRTKNYINLTSGTYEVTCTGAKLGNAVFYSVENKFEKMLSETHIPLPIKFTLTENKLVRVLFSNSESIPIAPTDIKNAILEADVSPEHPQDIVNSGKWNEETRKYEVDVKITGKNLFDIEKAEVSGGNLCTAKRENNIVKITAIETVTSKRAYAIVSGGGICLKAGKTYFLNGRKVGTSNMTPMFAFFKEKNIGELLKIGNFYTPNEDIYIDIGIYLVGNAIGTGDTLEITDIIVCEGKDAAQYQPYTEQTLTLTSDRPITKWDRLVEQGGQIGWLYKSKVYDGFDGKNNRIELGNKVGNVRHFLVYFASTPNSVGNANSYCDKYIGVNISWTKEKFGIFCDWNNGVKFFSAPNEKVTNLEEFKAWLIENPLGLAYETLEPEFVPLPQSEQNAIRALKTCYPTTVITADGGEVDPDIKVTYTADTKNYVDNKFGKTINAMQTKLLELESRV